MKDIKSIPVPALMRDLVLDARGYPIPYTVLLDDNNKPHFQINDYKQVDECITGRKCSTCGHPLGDDIWFIGGPLSALNPNGAYCDPPVHKLCGLYALQVCPWLSAKKYVTRIDDVTLNAGNFSSGFTLVDLTIVPERPAFFVMVKVTNYTVLMPNRYLVPERPFLETEMYLHGKRLTEKEAIDLYNEHYI